MAIGDVISQSDLNSLQRWQEKSTPQKGYISPTVYRLPSSTATRWPYFKTLQNALDFIKYMAGNKSVKLPVNAGYIPFVNTRTPQQLGINVDFYLPLPALGSLPVPYVYVREKYKAAGNVVLAFKFYKPNGSGPFYSILSSTDLGIAATQTDKLTPEKIAALDRLTREVALLKANYNALANFLDGLSKKTLSPVQQQVFNEGVLRLMDYKTQINAIKDIDFKFGKNSQVSGIGIAPAIAWLIFWAVTSIIAAYTITRIAAKWAEVAKVRSDNDAIQFITDANIRIAKDPTLTQQQKQDLINKNYGIIDSIEQHKETVEENAAKPGMVEQLMSLGKWAVIFYGIKIIGENLVKQK
jgi:hypothetical protein